VVEDVKLVWSATIYAAAQFNTCDYFGFAHVVLPDFDLTT